jgi:methionine-rich copper-binding protein CopC
MTAWDRRARLGVLGAIAVLSLTTTSAVSAHAEVVTATPAQGSTVTEPVTQIAVTYSEALTADSRLGIYDSSNNRIAVGMPDPANDHRAVATLDPALTAGVYTVKSTSISADDGDLDRQQWTFTVSPTPICTDGCNGQNTGEPSLSPTPTAAPSVASSPSASPPPDTSATSGTDAIVPIIAALAIVAVGGAFLVTRGRRSGTRR